MTIRNTRNKKQFEISKEEYENLIVAKGMSHKYEIVDDSLPGEIKSLRSELAKKKLPIEKPIKKGKIIEEK